MKYWIISGGNCGDQLGTWQAETEAEALEALAREAGYASKEESDRVLAESGGHVYPEEIEEITEDEYNAVDALLAAGYSDQGDALRDYREAVEVGDTWMLDTIVYGSLDEWKSLTRTEFNQALSNANHDPFPAFETSVETDAAYDAAWNRLQREGIIAAIEDYNEGRPDHMRLNFDECKEDFVDPDAGEWKPFGAWNLRWDLVFVCGTIEECRTMLGRIEADEALQERGWGEDDEDDEE